MTAEDPTDSATSRYDYGPNAQTDRDFESLRQKQKNVVEALVELGPETGATRIAEEAGVTDSYVYYVEENFPHIITHRRGTQQIASDGGSGPVNFTLTHDEALKAIRLLPEGLSETLFNQLRGE